MRKSSGRGSTVGATRADAPVASIGRGQDKPVSLRESFADRDAESPFEIVRREYDYPAIFEMESVSPKAIATFEYLADTKSEGKQCELALELGVSPGRVTQLKGEVGVALSRRGYGRPPGRRRSARSVESAMA